MWDLLFVRRGFEPVPGYTFFSVYPLVPWFGILAAGYGFGSLLLGDPEQRRRRLALLGAGMVLAFLVLRGTNGYGDPHAWSV